MTEIVQHLGAANEAVQDFHPCSSLASIMAERKRHRFFWNCGRRPHSSRHSSSGGANVRPLATCGIWANSCPTGGTHMTMTA